MKSAYNNAFDRDRQAAFAPLPAPQGGRYALSELTERESLAEGWIALHLAERDTEEYKKRFWAFNGACDRLFEDPKALWELVLLIFEKDKSDRIVQNLSAGPLESLLAQHGKESIERVENKAKQIKSLRAYSVAFGRTP